MFLAPVAAAAMAGGAFFATHDPVQAGTAERATGKPARLRMTTPAEAADAASPGEARTPFRSPRPGTLLRSRTTRSFLIAAALVPALSCAPADASEKAKGKLGKAGVEVSVAARGGGNQVIVRRNGREFAKYTSPQGSASILLCCTYNQCEPIGPTSFLVCDIVINCPDYHNGCFPQ